MATNSIEGLRRSSRDRKPRSTLPLINAKKVVKWIPRKSSRLQHLSREISIQNLRRSPRFQVASSGEKSERIEEKLLNIGKILNVEDLLKTGLLNGLSVTCFSETHQGGVPGKIKGGGFLCGCSNCNYNGEVLSVKMFEKHSGADTKVQADCVFFENGSNLHKVLQKIRNIPEEDVCVKILKLRGDLKQKQLSEAPPGDPAKSITAGRSKRKRGQSWFQRSVSLLDFGEGTDDKQYTSEKLEKDKPSESSSHLQKSFEGSQQVLKCYRRYNPERLLIDVQGLLSTGLLEGFRVTYKRNEARLAACIKGPGYQCGCTSCKNANVITAREIERHAGELSNNPNENIYLDNGITLCELVKELKGLPLRILGNSLREKIKCDPNYNSFEIWKGSFKRGDNPLNFRSDSERQSGSKQSVVQCISKDDISVAEATKNTDRITDASHPGDDYLVENLDSSSNQFLKQPIKSNNSNFLHCQISKPIIVSSLSETLKDGVPEGTDDLAKDSEKICQSKLRGEALISEATKNHDWTAISSHMRDNDSLKNLDSNSDQCLSQPNESTGSNSQLKSTENNDWTENSSSHVRHNDSLMNLGSNSDQCLSQPNESTSSNSQQCLAFEPTIVIDPAETITDSHSESISDLAEASVVPNTPEPYDVELNTAPVTGCLDASDSAPSDGINIDLHELQLRPAPKKIRSPRFNKIIKRNSHDGRSSLDEKTVQKVGFTFSGLGCATASDVTVAATEDIDYNPLEVGSKEGLTDVEKPSLLGIVKRRDGHLHKRLFEEGGLPDGTVLTYHHQNKVLLTGVKHGNSIKCSCHNDLFAPSQFEAHAGQGQRRQPYRNIYNSDGKTLHELSLELPDIPRSGTLNSRVVMHLQHKRRERIARLLVKKDLYVPTSRRLKRVVQSQKGVLVRCTICKERHATLGTETDPKLAIFCNQCDRAHHIGCLEDQESFKIKDVFNGNWFCCSDCIRIHNCLEKICALGAKPVPTPFFDLLKRPHSTDPVNLSWQIFRGGNAEDPVLLSHTLQFLKSAFQPILLGKQEIMRQMVFGKQVAGTGLDFRGMFFIMIKLGEEIVSVAALRVFGNFAAELLLATTSKLWQQQGYFRMLLSLIEELLRILQVRWLVSPVHSEMQSIWIDKFGFGKASDQNVQMLRQQHGVMLFEDTALLEKELSAVDD